MNKNIQKLLQDNFIYILFVIVVIAGGIYLLITPFNNVINNNKALQTEQESLENLKREVDIAAKALEQKKKQEAEDEKLQKDKEKMNIEKPIFKTTISGSDSFSANAPLFEDIIKILKSSKLKLVSIENKVSGFEDPITQNSNSKYNTCLIDMQMLGSYARFQKFLTYLYDYPYLINIKSIEIVPFDKDKNTLIINMSIILYSEFSSETENASI